MPTLLFHEDVDDSPRLVLWLRMNPFVTVAGPRRIHTGFPNINNLKPLEDVTFGMKYSTDGPLCQQFEEG